METPIVGPIPSPSTAWAQSVVSPTDELSVVPAPPAPQRRIDDAAALRARLLRMIAANEKSRKNAATEFNNQR